MLFYNARMESKIFKVNRAAMRSYSVLTVNSNIADVNFHYTVSRMTIVLQE